MNLDPHAAAGRAPAGTVKPRAVVIPGAAAIIAAAVNFRDAADEPDEEA